MSSVFFQVTLLTNIIYLFELYGLFVASTSIPESSSIAAYLPSAEQTLHFDSVAFAWFAVVAPTTILTYLLGAYFFHIRNVNWLSLMSYVAILAQYLTVALPIFIGESVYLFNSLLTVFVGCCCCFMIGVGGTLRRQEPSPQLRL